MLEDVRARLQRTIGGSRDTEEKLFAVKPISAPAGPRVVTIVTPVAKEPNASRNVRLSKPEPAAVAAPLRASILVDVGVCIRTPRSPGQRYPVLPGPPKRPDANYEPDLAS